jgi:hypothetical protein
MECSFAVVNAKLCQELRYTFVPLLEISVLATAIILLKVAPVHAMMTWGIGGIALLIRNLNRLVELIRNKIIALTHLKWKVHFGWVKGQTG